MSDLVKRLRNANGWDFLSIVQEGADRIEHLERVLMQAREALESLHQWSNAYPLSVFPQPDFAKAHELLQAGGMTLDAISASNMRHVVNGIGRTVEPSIAAIDEALHTEVSEKR